MNLPANSTTQRLTSEALNRTGACAYVAVRRPAAADVAARAAVIRIPVQIRAGAAATDGAFVAGILARSVDARAVFVGTRLFADVSTCATIVLVPVQERACPVAANSPLDALVQARAVDARAFLIGTGFRDSRSRTRHSCRCRWRGRRSSCHNNSNHHRNRRSCRSFRRDGWCRRCMPDRPSGIATVSVSGTDCRRLCTGPQAAWPRRCSAPRAPGRPPQEQPPVAAAIRGAAQTLRPTTSQIRPNDVS